MLYMTGHTLEINILDKSDLDKIIEIITDNTEYINLHEIYENIIYKYTNKKYYTNSRLNFGVSPIANSLDKSINNFAWHYDLNNINYELYTILVYIDEAKLDIMGENNMPITLNLQKGSIVCFRNNLKHRTNGEIAFPRRLIQYFNVCETYSKCENIYALIPEKNKLFYSIKENIRNLFKGYYIETNSLFLIMMYGKMCQIHTTIWGKNVGNHQISPYIDIDTENIFLLSFDVLKWKK